MSGGLGALACSPSRSTSTLRRRQTSSSSVGRAARGSRAPRSHGRRPPRRPRALASSAARSLATACAASSALPRPRRRRGGGGRRGPADEAGAHRRPRATPAAPGRWSASPEARFDVDLDRRRRPRDAVARPSGATARPGDEEPGASPGSTTPALPHETQPSPRRLLLECAASARPSSSAFARRLSPSCVGRGPAGLIWAVGHRVGARGDTSRRRGGVDDGDWETSIDVSRPALAPAGGWGRCHLTSEHRRGRRRRRRTQRDPRRLLLAAGADGVAVDSASRRRATPFACSSSRCTRLTAGAASLHGAPQQGPPRARWSAQIAAGAA